MSATDRSERDDYGPPPGYQPILLPGESISKYQRLAQAQAAAPPPRPEPAPARSKAPESPRPWPMFFPTTSPYLPDRRSNRSPPMAAAPTLRDERELENSRASWSGEPETSRSQEPAGEYRCRV